MHKEWKDPMTDPAVVMIVYHAQCIDGAASAWTVAKAHEAKNNDQPRIIYIPYEHFGKESAEKDIERRLTKDTALYFVDVAPDKKFLDKLLTTEVDHAPLSVHILDHHKSAADIFRDYQPPINVTVQKLDIDIQADKRSAARMVWVKMFPARPVPAVLDLIDKMDGDASGLKTAEDFAAAALIDSYDVNSIDSAIDSLRGLAGLTFNEMAAKGDNILRGQAFNLQKLLDQAMYIDMSLSPGAKPEPVMVINGNVQYFGRRISEHLINMAQTGGARLAMSWFMQKNGKITVSLRSNGNPDLSKVIPYLNKTLGCTGGGHAGAGALHFDSLFAFAQKMPSMGKSHIVSSPLKPDFPSIH